MSINPIVGICAICGKEIEKGKIGAVQDKESGVWVCGLKCGAKMGAKRNKLTPEQWDELRQGQAECEERIKAQSNKGSESVIQSGKVEPTVRQVKETRATCKVCGHVWHYASGDRGIDICHQLQCCPCLLPFQPKPEVGTSRCPKCGSSAIGRETVIHTV